MKIFSLIFDLKNLNPLRTRPVEMQFGSEREIFFKNCLKSDYDISRRIFLCSFLAMITVKFNDSARWKVYIHFTIPSERWRNWVKGDWPPPPNMTSHSGGTDCLSVSITDEDSLGRRFGWQPIRNFPRWHNCLRHT